MKRALFFVSVLMLCGCVTVPPKTPAQAVYSVEGQYAAALNIALAYRQLPDCSTGAPVCSTADMVAKVRAADAAAWASILTAQDAVRGGLTTAQIAATSADAITAVSQFTALVATLKVK